MHMDTLTARPRVLKQANLSLIRKVLKAKGTATRAEIAYETKISSTTVRSLLSEMMQNGEIQSVGYDESSGGRKAERYGFRPNRYYGAAFCITGDQIYGLLINVCGEIVEKTRLEAANGDFESAITAWMDEQIKKREIKSIGIGVPGAVEGKGYWRTNEADGKLYKIDIGDSLEKRYKIPVVLENDLNATAIGFGRCYAKEFPCENPENTNMAFLYFEKGCVSAGFISGGRVVRGHHNFAGELGLLPMEDGKTLDACMAEPMEDVRYVDLVVRVISFICGILNPQYVVLGGPSLQKDCIGPIGDGLSAFLPKHLLAEILYSPDVWHDYFDGMASLTAAKMFDEVQFIKEQPCL